ncbi:MAG: hypothetical protein MJ146_00050 [Clostridia bacterium]|nr:hypothetical protein [Clostridia bacterium]
MKDNNEENKGLNKVKIASIAIVVMSLLAFLIITIFTDYIGVKYGNSFENMALGLVAFLLIIAWVVNDRGKKK